MQFNLINWLFTDPCTATACTNSSGGIPGTPAEGFRYYIPWIIFCSVGVLIAFYYSVEGRKRFTKDRPALKYMLDRYLGWLAIICIIGAPLIFSRAYLYSFFFAWRFWRYLWLLGLLIWAILFVLHRVRTYPHERDYYQAERKRKQYMPKSHKGGKRKAATSR
jgi:hypothetical protein